MMGNGPVIKPITSAVPANGSPTGRSLFSAARAALLLTAAGMGGAVYAVRMAAVAAKAKRLRAERGIPEPSARQLDGGQDHNDQA